MRTYNPHFHVSCDSQSNKPDCCRRNDAALREGWFGLVAKAAGLASTTGDPHVVVANNNHIPDSIQRSVREQKKTFDLHMHKISRKYRENSERRAVSAAERFKVCESPLTQHLCLNTTPFDEHSTYTCIRAAKHHQEKSAMSV